MHSVVSKTRDFFTVVAPDVRNCGVCVCLSGGADSVALLTAINELAPELGLTVYACHFNHRIRGVEADRDESFCVSLCKSLNIPLFIGSEDIPALAANNGMSIEQAARECRYAFFQKVLSENGISYCTTAHTLDDNAETLLINLIRGSAGNGASAIPPRRGDILRPFLMVMRSEIEDYLEAARCEYVNDSTNFIPDCTRNYIRLNVLPMLRELNPRVSEALNRFAVSARNDRDYFDGIIDSFLDSDLRSIHVALSDRVILRKYKDFSGNILSHTSLMDIRTALKKNMRLIVSINKTDEAIIDNGHVYFQKKLVRFNSEDVYSLNLGENTLFDGETSIFIAEDSHYDTIINKIYTSTKLSSDSIYGMLYARSRQEGDRITVLGVNKSVKKLFCDKKVPAELRSIIPVICDDEGIVYIPFVAVSDRAFTQKNGDMIITTVLNRIDKERWVDAQ